MNNITNYLHLGYNEEYRHKLQTNYHWQGSVVMAGLHLFGDTPESNLRWELPYYQ